MSLASVSEQLLFSNNLKYDHLDSLLEQVSNRDLDYADLYFQSSYREAWMIENGIIKEGSYNINQGVGVRAISGEKSGFAYSDQINLGALNQSIKTVRNIVSEQGQCKVQLLGAVSYQKRYETSNPLSNLSRKEKIDLLYQIDRAARAHDHRVYEVTAILSATYDHILIAATDGTLASDIRPLVHLSIRVQVEQDQRRECGSNGGGGRFGYEYFLKEVEGEIRAESWAREAVRIAIINLSATNAPAGTMPVVLGPGWPGILLHEAVGHGLEGDFNRRGNSAFSNQVGKLVASEICTVVDDGTIHGLRGSITIDDEGVPGQYNILIENGRLKKYMQDKLNAKIMGVLPTGNARRESYACLPMPRMTNTYMLAGNSTREEIISSIDLGIYASNFGGGQVDITSGNFVFSMSEAYLIKKGMIASPIKGATLIGSGIEVMKKISMVGNDLSHDNGVGICYKEGQGIPVSVGQPTLKLDCITVGGTN